MVEDVYVTALKSIVKFRYNRLAHFITVDEKVQCFLMFTTLLLRKQLLVASPEPLSFSPSPLQQFSVKLLLTFMKLSPGKCINVAREFHGIFIHHFFRRVVQNPSISFDKLFNQYLLLSSFSRTVVVSSEVQQHSWEFLYYSFRLYKQSQYDCFPSHYWIQIMLLWRRSAV